MCCALLQFLLLQQSSSIQASSSESRFKPGKACKLKFCAVWNRLNCSWTRRSRVAVYVQRCTHTELAWESLDHAKLRPQPGWNTCRQLGAGCAWLEGSVRLIRHLQAILTHPLPFFFWSQNGELFIIKLKMKAFCPDWNTAQFSLNWRLVWAGLIS